MVPDWIPKEAWEGFVAMRKALKKPMTARAITMAVNKLEKMRAAGEDIESVLNQSEFNCWTDLYPVKKQAVAQWWTTEQGIIAKGLEMGIHALPGESPWQYKSRLQDALDGRSKPSPSRVEKREEVRAAMPTETRNQILSMVNSKMVRH